MGRIAFLVSGLVFATQACSNLGQTTAPNIEPDGTGGSGTDAGGPDIQFTVDIAPPPPTDGSTFEAMSMPTCVQAVPKIKNIPPDVLIVLDRSNSMTRGSDDQNCNTTSGNCTNGNKWVQVTTALNTVLPKTEDAVNWGLMFFGDTKATDNMTCAVGTSADVAPVTLNAAAIKKAMAAATPNSSTPTTVAIKNAAAYLKTLNDGNPKFILLATDGLPTCGTTSGGAGGRAGTPTTGALNPDDVAAIDAVKYAKDTQEIPTFVVGIATAGMADATLNKMAVNGGFPKTGGATQYYSVANGDELQAALASITTQAKTCFFGIDPAIDDQHKIEKVSADGRELSPSDFMQVGTTGVQLIDQACKDFTEGTIKDVVVQVNCNG